MISANPGSRRLEGMLYDRGSETAISGVVTDIQEFLCPCSGSNPGTHILLQTAEGSMQVHVADAQYLRTRGVSFIKGDQVQVPMPSSAVEITIKGPLISDEVLTKVLKELVPSLAEAILRDSCVQRVLSRPPTP